MSTPQPPIILASASPRRRELLEEAGYNFIVIPPADDVECGVCSESGPAGLVAEQMRSVSGGTDTHLVLADLREVGVCGRDAEARCDLARITLTKNLDPHEDLSPGQQTEIDRMYAAYPHLNDDQFVTEHLDDWLR